MTDNQFKEAWPTMNNKQLEVAARRYCRLMGLEYGTFQSMPAENFIKQVYYACLAIELALEDENGRDSTNKT